MLTRARVEETVEIVMVSAPYASRMLRCQGLRALTDLNHRLTTTEKMKMKFAIPTALLATMACTMLSASAQKSVKLKQGFPVGKKIHQSIVLNQKMKMAGIPGAPEGQGMNMTNKITMDMSMDIKKHGKDQKKAVVKYDRMAMLMDAGIIKQEFDSESDDGNPFTTIVGKEFSLIYDKDDKVVEVEGIEGFLGDAAEQPGIGDMLKQFMSEEQMKEMMNQGLLQDVPKEAQKIGDYWTYEMETPMPQGMGKFKVSGKYTVKRFDEYEGNPCVVIAMEGKLKSDGKTKMNMQGQEIEMEFKDSKFEGDIYFDNKLGLPRKSDMITKMKMNMGILGQNMTMDMNMTMISKITKIEESK